MIESILQIAITEWFRILTASDLFKKGLYRIAPSEDIASLISVSSFQKNQVILSNHFGSIVDIDSSDLRGSKSYLVTSLTDDELSSFSRIRFPNEILHFSLFRVTGIQKIKIGLYKIRAWKIGGLLLDNEADFKFIEFFIGDKDEALNLGVKNFIGEGIYQLCFIEKNI